MPILFIKVKAQSYFVNKSTAVNINVKFFLYFLNDFSIESADQTSVLSNGLYNSLSNFVFYLESTLLSSF